MALMPFDFLLRWLIGPLAIPLLGGGLYILYEWYGGELLAQSWLIAGWAMVIWSCLGFLPLSLLRRWGHTEDSYPQQDSDTASETTDRTAAVCDNRAFSDRLADDWFELLKRFDVHNNRAFRLHRTGDARTTRLLGSLIVTDISGSAGARNAVHVEI